MLGKVFTGNGHGLLFTVGDSRWLEWTWTSSGPPTEQPTPPLCPLKLYHNIYHNINIDICKYQYISQYHAGLSGLGPVDHPLNNQPHPSALKLYHFHPHYISTILALSIKHSSCGMLRRVWNGPPTAMFIKVIAQSTAGHIYFPSG